MRELELCSSFHDHQPESIDLLRNSSDFNLADTNVLRIDDEGSIQYAWSMPSDTFEKQISEFDVGLLDLDVMFEDEPTFKID